MVELFVVSFDELDRDGHVDLIYVDPEGHAGYLDQRGTSELTRRAVFQAPAGLLTHKVGEAQLFIVASEKPLVEADPTMYALLQAIHETGTHVDRQGGIHPARDPDPTAEALHFDTQAEMHADFNEWGVAMLGLSLRAAP